MSDRRNSPTVRRRRLSLALKKLREEAGLTAEEVTRRLEWSKGKLSRIELNQWVRPDIGDIRYLLKMYGVEEDDPQHEALIALARQSRQRGWWTPYRDVLGDSYVEFESGASAIRTFESLVIPGLLQTPGYAAELTRGMLIRDEEEIRRRVELRMERQRLFDDDDSPQLWAVIDEAALLRPVGGMDERRRQLQKLIETDSRDNIVVQVLPMDVGPHPGLTGQFVILDFPEDDPSIVYVESGPNGLYLEDPREIQRYTLVWQHLCGMALSPDASIAYLSKVLDRLE